MLRVELSWFADFMCALCIDVAYGSCLVVVLIRGLGLVCNIVQLVVWFGLFVFVNCVVLVIV